MFNLFCSKVMTKVKFFSKIVQKSRLRSQVLLGGAGGVPTERFGNMCNIIALPILVQKLWPRFFILKSSAKVKVKVATSKFLVPIERSFRKGYTCVIWNPITFA